MSVLGIESRRNLGDNNKLFLDSDWSPTSDYFHSIFIVFLKKTIP